MADSQTFPTTELEAAWRKVVARAWSDEEFKRRLLTDPRRVLADAGLPVSHDMRYVVIENEPRCIHLILPARPLDDVSILRATDGDYDPAF